ncbi:MAG: MmgE/PrpD family protein [Hasllibacter sp.]
MIEGALVALAAGDGPPEPVREIVRLSLLDWIACAVAGRDEPAAQAVWEMVEAEGGRRATLIAGGRAAARGAALANGTAGHALDYDDTHFDHIGHCSAAVMPAVLAAAEEVGAEGAFVLDAMAVGCEAAVRAGVWLGRSHYAAGFHQTATAGAFGAAMGCARLRGTRGEGALRDVLGIAAARASGLRVMFGTMGKPLNAGIAASNGVEAVNLADMGLTAPPDALSGPLGYGALHAGEGVDPGGEWRFGRVSHKLHACCHGLHAMLEALRALGADGDVGELRVTAHPRWATVCDQPAPETGLGAKFSFRTAAAFALLGLGTADPATWSDANARRADVAALRGRVRVEFDDALPETAARVAADGREAMHDLATAPADPARVRAKAALLLGGAGTWEAALGFAGGGLDLPALTGLMRQVAE